MRGEACSKLLMRKDNSWHKGTFTPAVARRSAPNPALRYKDAGEALRRKQDKEREAAGLPPVQRVGARGATPQRGSPRGGRGTGSGRGANTGGGRGVVSPARGGPKVGAAGFSGPRSFQQQDKNLWVHLVNHLKEKKLLPVVIFTFSKKKCEENAGTLSNTDLSTASEKSEVHVLIEKAITRLKGRALCSSQDFELDLGFRRF